MASYFFKWLVILPAKNIYSGITELQFRAGKLWQSHRQVQEIKGQNLILGRIRMGLGGVILNESPLEERGGFS